MRSSSDVGQPVDRNQPDAEFLKQRLEAISHGLKEGIRREVARLRRLGLPIYVADNGTVINRQTSEKPRHESPS